MTSPPLPLTRLDPRVVPLWRSTAALVLVPLVVAAIASDVILPLPWPRWLLTASILLLGIAAVLVLPGLRYRRWGYVLREHDLWIRRGVVWVTVSVIPYARLQFVDTRQGPLARLFDLAQLVVHTAAPGTSGTVPGLDAAQAEALRERLAAIESDVQPV